MLRNLSILLSLVVIVALPFALRQTPPAGDWRRGDPVLVIISPHNEAIRYEFEQAFSRWHQARYGKPVKIDWRNIGGTTEIIRYLASEYASSMRGWWQGQGKAWPQGATDSVAARRPPPDAPPIDVRDDPAKLERWRANRAAQLEAYQALRRTDDPAQVTCRIDLFFGGGQFDHDDAHARGLTVALPRADSGNAALADTLARIDDHLRYIPERLSGETWRTPFLFGNALSTFGIVYNVDRLKDLGIDRPPVRWDDLANPVYFRQVGVVDPTKSGSIAKAFEMIIHQKMHDALRAAGYSESQVAENEARIDGYIREKGGAYVRGDVPEDLKTYQAVLESGWLDGVRLVQAIGANARYFTDSGSKAPIDVSIGDAAVGIAIDFFGRFQAQKSRGPNGQERMIYVTPVGGTSVSCDPISLLRGAGGNGRTDEQRQELRAVAIRFIEFVLSEDGQRLWTYRPDVRDETGRLLGPEKYALRRLPIRRDFYPSTQPAVQAAHERHVRHATDDLAAPDVDPYQVAGAFTYYARWTGRHFGIQRDLIRAMCMDSGEELRRAWGVIHFDKPADAAARLERLRAMPTIRIYNKESRQMQDMPLNWRTAPDFAVATRYDQIEYMREWIRAFRDQYRAAATGDLH